MIVGASVGALNGWLIAAGVPPEEIERQWLDPSSAELMAWRKSGPLWRGLFDPRPLERRARFLIETFRRRMDLGVALLRLPRLQPVLVRNDEITWRHLVASCAIPLGFPPVRIGGALYVDGGLLDATPIWAAAAMGAKRVVAVNANRFVPPPGVGLMIRGVGLLARKRVRPAGVEVFMITPEESFGRMKDGAIWLPERIRRWIELGAADAAHLPL
jgi:NTE family protein